MIETVPSLLDPKRMEVLTSFFRETLLRCPEGEVWECGVYKGGSALALAKLIQESGKSIPLRLFDTFSGHPYDDSRSLGHRKGGYSDTDYQTVAELFRPFPFVSIHRGTIPETFTGLESSRIRLAHIDVDLYQSTKAAVEFIWPRLVLGGVLIDDDYFASECGARLAIDEYFWGPIPDTFYGGRGVHPQYYFVKES